MRIGELAALTGISVRSLRYYESKGLIASERTAGGYRDYSPMVADTVQSIRLYLDLGLNLEQIAGFLQCVLQNREAFCADIMPVYEKKLAEIEREIDQLNRIKGNLQDRIASIQAEQTAAGAAARQPSTAEPGGNHQRRSG